MADEDWIKSELRMGFAGGQGQRVDALDGTHVAELAGHGSGSAVYLVH